MPLLDRERSTLLLIDFQMRLMPAIEDGAAVVANARRLVDAAAELEIPVLLTEQNSARLGATVPELAGAAPVIHKMSFDASPAPGLLESLPADRAIVVAGCEAHVCVLQTVLGLLSRGRQVSVVRDAIGSRRAESKEAAVARMARHGAEMVTTEMALFEWLETCEHPRFRAISALIR